MLIASAREFSRSGTQILGKPLTNASSRLQMRIAGETVCSRDMTGHSDGIDAPLSPDAVRLNF